MEIGVNHIYRRIYDNPYDNCGILKPNEFLGEFNIIKVLENDLYNSISIGIRIPDNKVCLIVEREVTGYNNGSYFKVYELDGIKFENEEEINH